MKHHANLAGALLLATLALPAHRAAAEPVGTWNALATSATTCIDVFNESRLLAIAHIAMHDALAAIERRSRPYAWDGDAAGASAEAAVATAAHAALVAEFQRVPNTFGPCSEPAIASFDAALASALATVPPGPARDLGIAAGLDAAEAIVALRTGDGSDTGVLDFDWPEGEAPGEYRFTDFYPFAAAPGWGSVLPFVLDRADRFRPPPPYPVQCLAQGSTTSRGSCLQYAADLAEVAAMGGDDASGHQRTPEQTDIALFWVESSAQAWNRLARDLADARDMDSWERARMFGLLNLALADGYIASMADKYHFAYWRPVTAIRNADADGNPYTQGDPSWTPLDPTPPIPDYASAHAVEGAAAAEVLRRVLGSDHVAISMCSVSLREPERWCGGDAEYRRSFSRLSAAARENGESRILVGYHFRLAVEEGLGQGRRIGAHTVQHAMTPEP